MESIDEIREKDITILEIKNVHDDNLESVPLKLLIKLITNKKDINANIEFAHRVIDNNRDAVDYYLGYLTKPIVKYLSEKVMFREMTGEFFDFISHPYNEKKGVFMWKPITYYSGKNNCSLRTYTSDIASRQFYKIRKQEKEINNSSQDIIEYYDYESLLFLSDTTYSEEDEALDEMKRRLRIAFSKLTEKEKAAIQLLVIDKVSGLEAFDQLKKYLNPKLIASGEPDQWSAKEKQNRVSVLKGRALEKLLKLFNETN
jgi:hypothetical protein